MTDKGHRVTSNWTSPSSMPGLKRLLLEAKRLPESITDADLEPFLLDEDGRLQVFYAPLEWVNCQAEVVICGITPGRHTMLAALEVARKALLAGDPLATVAQRARQGATFSNMRKTLARRLDALGLHLSLGLTSCAEFFEGLQDLVHTTSCVRSPVFKDGKNYGGYEYLKGPLAEEVRTFPDSLFVPKGPAVEQALLLAGGKPENLLGGFPHASNGPGAAAREARFEAYRHEMAARVRNWSERRQARIS